MDYVDVHYVVNLYLFVHFKFIGLFLYFTLAAPFLFFLIKKTFGGRLYPSTFPSSVEWGANSLLNLIKESLKI